MGGVSHTDHSSALLSVTSVFFLQSEILHVLVYHVFPQLWRPLTSAVIALFMEFSSSLLITWPSHLNLAPRILSVMRDTPCVFLMTSFPFLSFSETPNIHRSILIPVLSSSFFCHFILFDFNIGR